jgi:predicted dienelactone hydrolase
MRELILVLASLAAIGTPAVGTIGFRQLTIPDNAGKPISLAVWYPSETAATVESIGSFHQTVAVNGQVSGANLPLVLISHGSQGSFASHYDTALSLAQEGFVVAALTHTGDNFMDQSYAGNRVDLTDRPRQVKVVLDYLLTQWSEHAHLDSSRVGMFGFSLGGFTTIVQAGGKPDLRRLRELCSTRPTAPECLFVRQRKGDQLDPVTTEPVWIHDQRVRAAVIAAPAVSYLFGPGSLKGISIPVQLWRASNDEQVPDEWNTAIIRKELPRPAEEHVVPRAGHYSFLPLCSDSLTKQAPQICTDSPDFDRAAFHRDFNKEVVAFFKKTLRN